MSQIVTLDWHPPECLTSTFYEIFHLEKISCKKAINNLLPFEIKREFKHKRIGNLRHKISFLYFWCSFGDVLEIN